jgi:hypothetical protein
MKQFFAILFLLGMLLPTAARADSISYAEAWAFLYDFPFTYQNGTLSAVGGYGITSGDGSVLPGGDWALTITDGRGGVLAVHRFDPTALANNTPFHIVVPAFFDGTEASVRDPFGRVVVNIDLRGSRVCDDNGVCSSSVGEDINTCPIDCGGSAAVEQNKLTAAVADQASIPAALGLWLVRISAGLTGALLLMGCVWMLDSRRSP